LLTIKSVIIRKKTPSKKSKKSTLMLENSPKNVAWLRNEVEQLQEVPQLKYEPIPRPEEVDRWLRLAYKVVVEYGKNLKME